jgi:hypothetical protein
MEQVTVAASVAPGGVDRRSPARRRHVVDVVGLALLAYVPFLFSSPGRVAVDTKQYLYLDPSRFLARVLYLWDPHVGFGTVPHQQIGYLFPMGPYYWLMDAVGVPDWVAQRIWLGSISFAAALGARWLFRMLGVRRFGALTGAVVYVLAPYQLAFTARFSVLLLAWAGLPWLIGLTMRAVRLGGWRDPALFALVILTIGSVNSSALVFVVLAPGLWLLVDACRGRDAVKPVLVAAARIVLLTVGVSLWWIVGLRTQGAYGLPVLQLTESLRTVAESSTPTDLLRGIGNWVFYGKDALGYSIDQASSYLHEPVVIWASFAIPVLALAAAGIVRWRHRTYLVLLVVVGTIVGVGAWPYDDPSPVGAAFKYFANNTAAGLALRNTPRVAPLIVLGLAGLLAAAVSAQRTPRRALVAASVVSVIAVLALVPVWRDGFLSSRLDRPNAIPGYWDAAARAMGKEGTGTRVLEVPGMTFSAYRWGNTVEPVTPGLTDRPYVAREVLPAGSPPSVELLMALDHRLQEGTLEPNALAAYARLTAVGTIAVRSDIQYERFNTPRPRALWQLFTDPVPEGLRNPRTFGPAKPNRAEPGLNMLDDVELRIPRDAPNPPPVALFDVTDPVPNVHAAPTEQPVLLSGDGEGIVDLAGAGLIDGNQLVFQTAAIDDKTLARVLHDGADLVLTDTNRRRSEHYFSRIRDTSGYTERVGETAPHNDDAFVLEPYPDATDDNRTVTEQDGATVTATDYAVSADRPAYAFDGNPRTAWRVGENAVGQQLTIRPDQPVRADHVTITQLPAARSITSVRLHFGDGTTIDALLGPESLTPAGQVISFPEREVGSLGVEIRDVSVPEIDPEPRIVGLTDVTLGDARVREVVRLPVDIARRVGTDAAGHRLDVVLSRLRYDPGQIQDEELALDRRFVLPDARGFGLSGTARINPNVADDLLDTLLGTTAPGTTFTASSHLAGDLDARASRAFDGDPATAWSPNFGPQEGQWVDAALPAPTTVDHVDLTIVADGKHSLPTQFTLAADGAPVRQFTVDPGDPDRAAPGGVRTIRVSFDPVTGRDFRLTIDAVDAVTGRTVLTGPPDEAPVGLADVGLGGVPRPADPEAVPVACRSDLLEVNGAQVPVQVVGPVARARSGLSLEPCGAPLALPAGSNTLQSTPGLDTGIDIDRVVLTSDAAAAAAPPTVLGAPLDQAGATVKVVSSRADRRELSVRTDGKPFWLVFGESNNAGWEATASSGRVGARQLVNGFANGWLVTPRRAGTMEITLQWTPQRFVWFGLAVSVVAVLACLVLLAVAWRRRRRRDDAGREGDDPIADPPVLASPFASLGGSPSTAAVVVLAVGAAVGTALISRPWIGLVVGAACVVAARVSGGRILFTAGAPLALALARLTTFDDLGWLAIALLAADLVTAWVRVRSRRATTAAAPPTAP